MRILDIGTQRFTKVEALDDPGAGGAYHNYLVTRKEESSVTRSEFAHVSFQNGPIGENGVNGCHQEDLIAIVIHRLQCFQSGDFRCRENALALTKLEEAMHWLNSRTQDRQNRGVEGTSVV